MGFDILTIALLLNIAGSSPGLAEAEGDTAPLLGVAEPQIGGNFGLHGLPGASALIGSPGGGAQPRLFAPGNLCGSSDLSNLLVYQHLIPSLPKGVQVAPVSHLPIQAILASSQLLDPVTTVGTFVSTSLTTTLVTKEPSTIYSTETSVYVTTITSVVSSVIPVIFRGSKIVTTITDTSTTVITPTTHTTHTTINTPSYVQTFPVHITFTSTRTQGPDGEFTLVDLTPGASSVVHKPLSTQAPGINNLDLNNLDLSQFDLTSLLTSQAPENNNKNMISALSALLKQFSDDEPSNKKSLRPGLKTQRPFDKSQVKTSPRFPQGFNDKYRSVNRFSNYEDDFPYEEEHADIEVLDGFVLEDRASKDVRSGSASSNTRFAKFAKSKPFNNGIATDTKSGREDESFSETTNRNTVSRTNRRSSRPVRSQTSSKQRSVGRRPNRQTSSRFSRFSRPRTSSPRFKRQLTSPLSVNENLPIVPVEPQEIVKMLKSVDKSLVKEMLENVRKWADFYSNAIDLQTNEISDLSSSLMKDKFLEESSVGEVTTKLADIPMNIASTPSFSSSSLCSPPSTLTETVYKTVYISS